MKFCRICGGQFVPSKYRPSQGVCNNPNCQKERQRQNVSVWRQKNPDYFKYASSDPVFKEMIRQKQLLWRRTHPQNLQEYKLRYREKTRVYMKDYMRKYRLKKKNIALYIRGQQSPESSEGQSPESSEGNNGRSV